MRLKKIKQNMLSQVKNLLHNPYHNSIYSSLYHDYLSSSGTFSSKCSCAESSLFHTINRLYQSRLLFHVAINLYDEASITDSEVEAVFFSFSFTLDI